MSLVPQNCFPGELMVNSANSTCVFIQPQQYQPQEQHQQYSLDRNWIYGQMGENLNFPLDGTSSGNFIMPTTLSSLDYNAIDFSDFTQTFQTIKPRPPVKNTSNKKERKRTQSINTAFAQLRGCIPNVPSDTKLSKIKTLRLATSYISYLMEQLAKREEGEATLDGFHVDISKKMDAARAERRRAELENILKAGSQICGSDGEDRSSPHVMKSYTETKRSKGRTGWPEDVWAAELKT